MLTVDLKKEHKLFDESKEADGGINYQGNGMVFLKKDFSEKLQYCEDLDRDEADELFKLVDEYYFGECNLDWQFIQKPTMGRGKVAMFFAKYWKNGYFEEPYE